MVKKHTLFLPERNCWMIITCLGLLLSEQTTVLGQVIESAPHEAFSNPALDRGSKYALGILDSSLELLGRWGWGACRGVAGMGDYLLTGSGPTLLWLDATDRHKPVIVWEKMTSGSLTNFVIRDSIGYALVGSSSLLVIDLRNPATPIIRSEFPIVSRLLSLAVEGTTAFVKRYLGYVYCIDVSNPSSPFLRATIRGTSAQWGKLTISDHNLYIGDQSGFTEHIDVSNLDSALVTTLENVAFTATAVLAKDTLLFLGNGSDRLYIYSTSVPNSPTRLSNFSIGFSGIVSIAVDGQRAFVGTGDGRIVAIRISDLRNPVVLGVYSPSITRPGISATHVVSRDTFLVCAYGYCLTGISTADPGSMNVLSNFETGYGNPKVKVRDGLAYVTSGYSGVWVVDVSQPEQPRRLSNLHTEGFANDIVLDSANAYISLNDPQYLYSQDANNGILAVDITRTESLSVIGSLTMDSPFAISKSGSLLFVAQSNNVGPSLDTSLAVLDVSNPRDMRLLGRAVAGDVREVASRDSIAFVSSSSGVGSGPRGLSIFDCRIPANPHILSIIFSYAQGVSVDGNYAFVHRGDSTFSLDISNLTCPQVLGRVNHPSPNYNGATESLTKGGIVFWTSGGEFGLINVADANAPRSLFEAEISGSGGIDVVNDTIYVTRPDGLWIFRYRRSSSDFREQNDQSRTQTQLAQNYPNPFNSTTRLRFDVTAQHEIKITVYDLLGQVVSEIFQGKVFEGSHYVVFDAARLPSGVYFCKLVSGNTVITRRMLLLK